MKYTIFRYALMLVTFFSGFIAVAQTPKVTLKGSVYDNNNKAVEYATITILKRDSSVANGALSEADGSFAVESLDPASYIVRISGMGYTTHFLTTDIKGDNPVVSLGKISIRLSSVELNAVNVVAEKPAVEMTAEKKSFNVEKNITSTGGSAADVLQNVPSITVDADGNVSLRGNSGVSVLIDGKPATLLGSDVASALQSLSAASIETVEVITNPSAKYDAQGMGGIINIVTKKNKKAGYNGTVTAGIGTRDKYNAGVTLNVKNEKWNLFLNSNYRYNVNRNNTITDRENHFNTQTFKTDENGRRINDSWFTSLGAEYALSERTTIGLTENLNLMGFGGKGETFYRIYDDTLQGGSLRTTDRMGRPTSLSSSLDFKHKFVKPKTEISANITFVTTQARHNQTYNTYTIYPDNSESLTPIIQENPSSGKNNSLNGQIDYSMPLLTKNGKLELGLKTQSFWFDSKSTPTITYPGMPAVADDLLRIDYRYSQGTHAAYASFGDEQGKFSYQAGLRLEYSKYEGTANNTGVNYFNDYLSLFPSAFVSYRIDKTQSVVANYTRRTNRPWFMQLVPIVNVSNPQDTSIGNPNLRPEFINSTELNYTKNISKAHTFIGGVYYQYTENIMQRYTRFYDNGTSVTQTRNLNSASTYGAEITGRFQLNKIWDLTANINYFQNRFVGNNIDPLLNRNGQSWFAKANTSVKLPHNFSIQVNGNYESPKIAGQADISDSWWLDIAIRKTFWNSRGNLVLNVSDIFNTHKYTNFYNLPAYYQSAYRDRETRIGNLTFTYRFGRDDYKVPNGGRRRNTGNQQNNQPQNRESNLKGDDSGGDN